MIETCCWMCSVACQGVGSLPVTEHQRGKCLCSTRIESLPGPRCLTSHCKACLHTALETGSMGCPLGSWQTLLGQKPPVGCMLFNQGLNHTVTKLVYMLLASSVWYGSCPVSLGAMAAASGRPGTKAAAKALSADVTKSKGVSVLTVAMPRSAILICLLASSNRFRLLMSRCKMPF